MFNFEEFLVNKKINYDQKIIDKLNIFYETVISYNKKINLTTIIKKDDFFSKHFADSLIIYNFINKKEIIKVGDIGTGAGFPGIVLALFFSNKHFYLIEPIKKRCLFLKILIKKIELKNVTIINKRAEDIKKSLELDLVTSRAVAKTRILIEITHHLLKEKGYMIFNKGILSSQEKKEAMQTINILDKESPIKIFKQNYSWGKRTIIKIQKNNQTPKNIPRNYSLIKKNIIKGV